MVFCYSTQMDGHYGFDSWEDGVLNCLKFEWVKRRENLDPKSTKEDRVIEMGSTLARIKS